VKQRKDKLFANAAHDLSAGDQVLDGVAGCARTALAAWGCGPDAAVSLLHVSENATFGVDDPDSGRSVLRVHRLGYHSRAAIESELAWLDALRGAGVRTPRVLPALDGRRVVSAAAPGGGPARHCVRFEFLPGAEPPADAAHFTALGELTAQMHAHARAWPRPAGFTRFAWDLGAAFGPSPRWGHWRHGPGVGPAEAAVLSRAEREVTQRLAAYGTGPGRFGLIHADLRLANLLASDGRTAVIDFDDCGLGWYLYDLAAAVSFFEDDPAVPGLIDAWLAGYRRGGGVITAADEAETWTFVLLRRLLLLGWIGTHPASAGVAELSAGYAAGSCELAGRYLSGLC
jgi:Ser/Thr protein kinase RdoA (MazF antagonist)